MTVILYAVYSIDRHERKVKPYC